MSLPTFLCMSFSKIAYGLYWVTLHRGLFKNNIWSGLSYITVSPFVWISKTHESESGQMRSKNVKWAWSVTQCEIIQKNEWNSSNSHIHWFQFPSDNSEATAQVNSSFWPVLPKFLRGSVENDDTLKFVGPRTRQSRRNQICVRKKNMILGLLFGRNHRFDLFRTNLPPNDIHCWNAMDLRFYLAPSYWHLKDPTRRQNFDDLLK